MWFTKYKRSVLVLAVVLSFSNVEKCIAISNTQFNASLRDYSAPEDINSTDVSTLQKNLQERYAQQQSTVSNKIRFVKEIPDSVLSGSSHGRGLLQLNHHGFGIADYEESPHYSYGYEHHYPSDDHYGHFDDHHHVDHHHPDHHHHPIIHHDDHKHSYGHHYKHYDHALATKAVLWPIAGIALLGAAAALVTNPVLLQLGVVSGKRRRRDAEENITDKLDKISKNDGMDNAFIVQHLNNFNKDADSITRNGKRNNKSISYVKRSAFLNKSINNNNRLLFRNVNPTMKAASQSIYVNKPEYNRDSEDKRYIPVPLKMKDSN